MKGLLRVITRDSEWAYCTTDFEAPTGYRHLAAINVERDVIYYDPIPLEIFSDLDPAARQQYLVGVAFAARRSAEYELGWRYESAVRRLVSQVRIRKHYDNQAQVMDFEHRDGCRLCAAFEELSKASK